MTPDKQHRKIIEMGPFQNGDSALQQEKIQACFDNAGEYPAIFKFAPGDYLLGDARGLRVPDGATLILNGVRFLLSHSIEEDGQAFLLENVSNVTFEGGEIIGERDIWAPSVNVAGIRVFGNARNIRIFGLVCRDLSSNAVGVFGDDDKSPVKDVFLSHVVGVNCCNIYHDYLEDSRGPAPGSAREDQGIVALYHVDGWLVDACRFEDSQSDGTHFFHCQNGRFINNTVTGSRMGGYFLEGCEHILASGNLVAHNASRGVTIERDSRYCTFSSNIVLHSGREGLWMPDVSSIIVSNNLFKENGRKDDGDKDCEIRVDNTEEYETKTHAIHIAGNVFQTSAQQTAALYIGDRVNDVIMRDNVFKGPAPDIAGKISMGD